MRISPDGLSFFLPPAAIAAGLLAMGHAALAGAFALLALAVAAFFRDPERVTDAPAGAAVSPADGRVIGADDTADGCRVSIFLSLFDVHVARAPVGGRLLRCVRRAGGTAPAFSPRAERNARVEMTIAGPAGTTELRLMAGLVARRVLPWVAAPRPLRRGQRVAIIRFGSRADVLLPPGYRASVRVGDRVRAGVTPIAVWQRQVSA